MRRDSDPEALVAVEAARRRLGAAHDVASLIVHRLHLQATITTISPLTRDVADFYGFDLADVAAMLRPARAPTLSRLIDRPRLHAAIVRNGPSPVTPSGLMRASDLRMARRIAREGVILDVQGRYGRFGVVPDEGTLAAAGWLGESWFCTDAGTGHILLGGEMPETVIAAVPGRLIGEVVDHPVLRNRGYRVKRVTRLPDDVGIVVSFDTGLIRHEMPWRRLLAQEIQRCS